MGTDADSSVSLIEDIIDSVLVKASASYIMSGTVCHGQLQHVPSLIMTTANISSASLCSVASI
jgi:hypothetical protein